MFIRNVGTTILHRVLTMKAALTSDVALGAMILTLRLLMSYIYIYIYIYGAPSKARNANVVYIWTYV